MEARDRAKADIAATDTQLDSLNRAQCLSNSNYNFNQGGGRKNNNFSLHFERSPQLLGQSFSLSFAFSAPPQQLPPPRNLPLPLARAACNTSASALALCASHERTTPAKAHCVRLCRADTNKRRRLYGPSGITTAAHSRRHFLFRPSSLLALCCEL